MTDQIQDELERYHVQAIEFRDGMIVVNFTEPDELRNRLVQDHISRVILPGDPDVDGLVRQITADVQDLIEAAHVAHRQPPETRPAGRRER